MKNLPIEEVEVKKFVKWLNELLDYKKVLEFSHIPNETSIKNFGYLNKIKALGKRKGVPDFIVCTKKTILFVEMKRQKNAKGKSPSKVHPEQTEWLRILQGLNIPARVCYGFEDAKQFVKCHL